MVASALDNTLAYLNIVYVDFGVQFQSFTEKNSVTKEVVNNIKYRCQRLLKLLKYARNWFRGYQKKINLHESIKHFEPKSCTSQFQPAFKDLLISLLGTTCDLDVLEQQWRKMPFIKWFDNENMRHGFLHILGKSF